MSEDERVVALLPSGETARFPNYSIAKAMLLKKYHQYIYRSADEMYERLNLTKMEALAQRIIEAHRLGTVTLPKNAREASLELYDLMYNNADKVFEEGKRGKIIQIKDKESASECNDGPLELRSYWLLYEPGVDPVQDGAYLRLAPQCRAVLNVLLDQQKTPGELMSEPTVYKYIMRDQQHIKTKQSKWRIFKYYRSSLIAQNFMRMTK